MSDAVTERVIAALPDHVRATLSEFSPADARACRLEELGVSSLETVEMVEALEEGTGVEFEVDELLELMELTLGELSDRIERKLASGGAAATWGAQDRADDGALSSR